MEIIYTSDEKKTNLEKYLTKEQYETITKFDNISDDGSLLEINYIADYKLDQFLSSKNDTTNEYKNNIKELLIPKQIEVEDILKHNSLMGCSAFSIKLADGRNVMGRNYDWNIDIGINAVIHTYPKNGYKSIGLSDLSFIDTTRIKEDDYKANLLFAPYYIVDGMNEKGLACTILILERESIGQNTGKNKLPEGVVVRMVIDKAANVDEAIMLISGFDLYSPIKEANFHWLITDKTGDAAIIEIVDGKLNVIRKNNEKFLTITNFYKTNGAENNGLEGFWRDEMMQENFTKNSKPSIEEAMKVLKDIRYFMNDQDTIKRIKNNGHDPNDKKRWHWETVWSEIYDLEKLELYMCYKENYSKVYKFKINY